VNYEAPAITQLGSLAGFTRGDGNELEFDGVHYIHIPIGKGISIPIIDITGPGTS
jgi:hypothetical protein